VSNTSATGGVLAVAAPDHTGLEDVLNALIAGVLGLPPELVRPLYQRKPPKQPDKSVDWCAFGITGAEEEAHQLHPGEDGAQFHTEDLLSVLVSLYGPNAWNNGRRLTRALAVPQNRAPLRRAGLALVSAGSATTAPDLVGGEWVSRVDVPLTIRQGETGDVAVLSLTSAPTSIIGDTHHE
jgi:hypothetical protein